MTGALLSTQGSDFGSVRGTVPRWRRLVLAAICAGLLHWLLFAGVGPTFTAFEGRAQEPATLRVRTVDAVALTPTIKADPNPAMPELHAAPPLKRKGDKPAPSKIAKASPAPAATETVTAVQTPARPAVAATAVPQGVAAAVESNQSDPVSAPTQDPESPATAPVGPDEAQVYATVIPAPAVLQFRMRRGILYGNAELTWRPDQGRYEARLEARASGLTLLTQVSQGGFDAAGLAPQRFTDKRFRSSAVAANFQRPESGQGPGKVTFSASQAEFALQPGAQDRLSWMIQLPAIASAEPQRLAAQGRISMQAIGARGDATTWQFISLGEEILPGKPAAVRVYRLQRVPQTPYDTRIDIWLDAQAPHWPVRAHLSNGANDPGFELWRIDTTEPR